MRDMFTLLKPENQHDRNYLEFRDVIDEIERMAKEMEYVLTIEDKVTAAKAIREHWDPKMDVALDKVKIALAKRMVAFIRLPFSNSK